MILESLAAFGGQVAKVPLFVSDFYNLRGKSEHHYECEDLNFNKKEDFDIYCLLAYLCLDFALFYHDLEWCPDFYFSSLKTLF